MKTTAVYCDLCRYGLDGLAVMKTLTASLPAAGLVWLAAGGILYSIGIYWFVNDKKIRHGHGIWHLFVLGGSITQFISVYGYVI